VIDTRPALADLALQIRGCRSSEGLTLQQLATRSGVAASTIHKIEAQQMVPTVSVLLKIAKGLDRRPETLVRDEIEFAPQVGIEANTENAAVQIGTMQTPRIDRIALDSDETRTCADLAAGQRATVIVDAGTIELRAGGRCVRLTVGECIEIEGGGRIEAQAVAGSDPARFILLMSPPKPIESSLGASHEIRAKTA
jgi:transcriptional regulator with XRE-family HTH domain